MYSKVLAKWDRIIVNRTRSIMALLFECHYHFDAEIAKRVCERLGQLEAPRRNPRSWNYFERGQEIRSLGDLLDLFPAHICGTEEREFLASYLEELRDKVHGKAPCRCLRINDTPCEHDMSLLDILLVPAPPNSADDPGTFIKTY